MKKGGNLPEGDKNENYFRVGYWVVWLRFGTKLPRVYPEFLHPKAHNPFRYSQIAGCPRLVATRCLERIQEHVALHILQRVFQSAFEGGAARFGSLKSGGEVVTVNHRIGTQQYSALHAILQFPDISRPVVAHEHVYGRSGNAEHILVVRLAVALHEEISQQGDVGSSFTECRNVYRKDVESVVEILSELPILNECLKVSVRRCNYPHIRPYGSGSADPVEFLLLEDPEELDLCR